MKKTQISFIYLITCTAVKAITAAFIMKSMEMLYLYSERLIIHLFQLSFHLGNWLHRANSLKKNYFHFAIKSRKCSNTF